MNMSNDKINQKIRRPYTSMPKPTIVAGLLYKNDNNKFDYNASIN